MKSEDRCPICRGAIHGGGVGEASTAGRCNHYALSARIAELKAKSDENHRGYVHASVVGAGWKAEAQAANARIATLTQQVKALVEAVLEMQADAVTSSDLMFIEEVDVSCWDTVMTLAAQLKEQQDERTES